MRFPKLTELKEIISALIKGPYTSKFPYKKIEVYDRFRGKPSFYKDFCVGCTACVSVCPAKALEFKDEIYNGKAKRVLKIRWDRCIFCGNCEANCLVEKGIRLSSEFDLATLKERDSLVQEIEKELLVCENCNEVIAPVDQVLWVINKLGPLYTSNTTLIFFTQKFLNISDSVKKQENEILRKDRFSLLCPRCRRKVVFTS